MSNIASCALFKWKRIWYSSFHTKFDCSLYLGLHFSNLGNFFTLLFDAKTMGVSRIHTSQPKRDGDRFPISKILEIAS